MLMAHLLWDRVGMTHAATLTDLRGAYDATMRMVNPELRYLWDALRLFQSYDRDWQDHRLSRVQERREEIMSEVTSVNGHTGAVVLTAADVEAVPTSAEGQPGGVATLNGSGVLSEAQVPSSVVSSSIAIKVLATSPGESTDCAKLIQEAYDAGYRWIILDGTVPWYINSPVFFDKEAGYSTGVLHQRVRIETTTSAPLILGPNLPTTAAFTKDATVKWAFWPGTLRSAYNKEAGTVTCTNETAVKGEAQQGQPGVEYIGYVDGANHNAGVGFGNQCSQIFGMNSRRLKLGISWTGYVDHNGLRRQTAQPGTEVGSVGAIAGSCLMYQQTNGDGVLIEPVETDGEVTIWNARQCHGGTVMGSIAGAFSFTECSGIELISGHTEMHYALNVKPSILVNCSEVTLRGFYWDAGVEAGHYFLEINDTGAGRSKVKLDHCTPVLSYAAGVDYTRAADVYIGAMYSTSELVVQDTKAVWVTNTGGVFNTSSLVVKSAVAGITAALNNSVYTVFQKARTQASRWVLHRQGESEAWIVDGGSPLGGLFAQPAQANPILEATASTNAKGTLVEGKKYEYMMALYGDDNLATKHSAGVVATVTSSGAIALTSTIQAAPAGVMLWRGLEGKVLTEPEGFVLIPFGDTFVNLIDTGANVDGTTWKTTEVPLAGTIAASNQSPRDMVILPNKVKVISGPGTPQGAVTATAGSIFLRTDAEPGKAGVYVNQTGTGTGWYPVGGALLNINTTGKTSAEITTAVEAAFGPKPPKGMLIVDETNKLILYYGGTKWFKSAALTEIA